MSIAVDVAPPATPLPSTKTATAKIVGHRLPKTFADSPKMGIKTVLNHRVQSFIPYHVIIKRTIHRGPSGI